MHQYLIISTTAHTLSLSSYFKLTLFVIPGPVIPICHKVFSAHDPVLACKCIRYLDRYVSAAGQKEWGRKMRKMSTAQDRWQLLQHIITQSGQESAARDFSFLLLGRGGVKQKIKCKFSILLKGQPIFYF